MDGSDAAIRDHRRRSTSVMICGMWPWKDGTRRSSTKNSLLLLIRVGWCFSGVNVMTRRPLMFLKLEFASVACNSIAGNSA
ncbi:uncharacterized protein LOC112507503 isoform X1 [Cynara cardunculus var. scolymus]|uniref:uncharacterized protein LOC112507503 isoform X1 n=1 Tax=Cynara cardunculus var. scolymus TaxID=59895 RepID=UPI000D623788|nr:uncharacterized protein LOC112507503 isoform X1 [Cynara cardunculus var. scolymus]